MRQYQAQVAVHLTGLKDKLTAKQTEKVVHVVCELAVLNRIALHISLRVVQFSLYFEVLR